MLQKHESGAICYNCKKNMHALVAQLDRVSVSEAEGRGFDSRRAHQACKLSIIVLIFTYKVYITPRKWLVQFHKLLQI